MIEVNDLYDVDGKKQQMITQTIRSDRAGVNMARGEDVY
jgi:hypothetical protein